MNLGTAEVIQADSRNLPLDDNSVDLVVTSPPYFALRSYQDGGEHYDGQIGAEPTPDEFVSSLLEVTRECIRVLKPSGSLWVNLGDKYAGQGSKMARSTSANSSAASYSASPESPSLASSHAASAASASERSSSVIGIDPTSFRQGARNGNRRSRPSPVEGIPGKSLMGIPWRYALRCIDDLGLILRAEVIWSKPNGLPESVTDRVRRSHEQWFHFTLQPRYFSTVDEIREPHKSEPGREGKGALNGQKSLRPVGPGSGAYNPLGALPGSVWTVPTEPLRVPDNLGVDHFAAFPTQWPLRIIKAWCPEGLWTCKCGQKELLGTTSCACCGRERGRAPASQGVVLDPFGGTGTTAMVAKALGRHGISVDMSADYCRLAEWRTNDRDQIAKVLGLAKADPVADDEQSLLDLLGGGAA